MTVEYSNADSAGYRGRDLAVRASYDGAET